MIFGITDAVLYAVNSPFTELGGSISEALNDTVLGTFTGALGSILDSRWAWAAVAISAGLLGKRALVGAAAGATAMTGAMVVYLLVDHQLRGPTPESTDPLPWIVASLTVGAGAGLIGHFARRRDLAGTLCRLVMPLGALTQWILMPPGYVTVPPGYVPGFANSVGATTARVAVLIVAGAAAIFIVANAIRRRSESGLSGAD